MNKNNIVYKQGKEIQQDYTWYEKLAKDDTVFIRKRKQLISVFFYCKIAHETSSQIVLKVSIDFS